MLFSSADETTSPHQTYQELGQKLRQLRNSGESAVSQQEIADSLGITRWEVQQWEKGKKAPDVVQETQIQQRWGWQLREPERAPMYGFSDELTFRFG